MTDEPIIFITGASRSGTTLLSFVLRNQPEVFGLKELQYFGDAWDPREIGISLSRSVAIGAVASMYACQQQGVLVRKVTPEHRSIAEALVDRLGAAASDPASLYAATTHAIARAAGKSIPCEQTPRYIFYARALLDVYPEARIVHMVRDPRAVMASQKQRWRRRHLARDGKVVPRYESLRVWVNYHPYTVARLWSQATRAALALADHPRVTLIRFEDLVQQPEATVRLLCRRLELDYDRRMLDVRQVNSSHQSSAGGARTGLHADAIDKWREVLTPAEISITEKYCGTLMQGFGYKRIATARATVAEQVGYPLSYVAHLGGVLLVNPRRALVQTKALLRSGSRARSRAPREAVIHGEMSE